MPALLPVAQGRRPEGGVGEGGDAAEPGRLRPLAPPRGARVGPAAVEPAGHGRRRQQRVLVDEGRDLAPGGPAVVRGVGEGEGVESPGVLDVAAAGFCALAADAVREAGPIRVRLTAEPEARPVGPPPP